MLLLSGGIDSPVAGWLLGKEREVMAVHFSMEPLTDNEPEEKSRKLAENLGFKPFVVENIAKELKDIAEKCNRRFYFVLMKREMFRRAERLAKEQGCDFIATGESLGQVSSQTLENLAAIDAAVEIPVLRPLIGMDKQDIVRIAEKVGSFQISCGKEVCDVLGPEKPATRARLDDILEQEQLLKKAL